jgi:hypothetical protein
MKKKWKEIKDIVQEAMGHYWVYDTNEGVVEGWWDPDHRKMEDVKGNQFLAVTHFKEYYTPDDPMTEIRNNSISDDFVDFQINLNFQGVKNYKKLKHKTHILTGKTSLKN